MSKCEYYQELISRLIDGQLSGEEHSALTSHLETCSECAILYQAFSTISDSLSEQLEQPPKALSHEVMAHLRRQAIINKNRAPMKKILTAAACVAVILLAASGIIPRLTQRSASLAMSTLTVADSAGDEAPAADVDAAANARLGNALPESEAEDAVSAQTATEEPAAEEYVVQQAVPTETPAKATQEDAHADGYGTATVPAPTAAPAAVPTAAPAGSAALDSDNASIISGSVASGGAMMASGGPASSAEMPLGSEPPVRVELATQKLYTSLTSLLNGKESDFDPMAENDKNSGDDVDTPQVYIVVLMPDEKLELTAYVYEKEVYYTVLDKAALDAAATPAPTPSPDKPTVYLAKCSVEDFMKFINTALEAMEKKEK